MGFCICPLIVLERSESGPDCGAIAETFATAKQCDTAEQHRLVQYSPQRDRTEGQTQRQRHRRAFEYRGEDDQRRRDGAVGERAREFAPDDLSKRPIHGIAVQERSEAHTGRSGLERLITEA